MYTITGHFYFLKDNALHETNIELFLLVNKF